MYALSVKQPYAEEIASGRKRIEYRTWMTKHRGPLLIVASKGAEDGGEDLPRGVAICVVDIVKVTGDDGDYKWHLGKPRRVHPVQVMGYAALYMVPDDRVVLASTEAAPGIFALPPKKAPAARTGPKRTRRELAPSMLGNRSGAPLDRPDVPGSEDESCAKREVSHPIFMLRKVDFMAVR